jgi:hypothetical protein
MLCMTTATPLPLRRAISDDRLLDSARTRRQLTDTALVATGGGHLSALTEDAHDRELWHALIRRQDGRRLQVHLDRRLGTVVVQDVFDGATRAA